MTKSQSNSCTYHLRSNRLAAKRKDVKIDSASSSCPSNSSDSKNDTLSEPLCKKIDKNLSRSSFSWIHSQDAQRSLCKFGPSSAAASVHLASTLTCTKSDGKKKTRDVTADLAQQNGIGQQTFLFDQNSSSYSNIHSSPVVIHKHRKQRAHSVIPVYPLHSSLAQSVRSNKYYHQREDELNAFCFSALCTSVDHPNSCCCYCLNSCNTTTILQQSKKQQLYQVDYSFRLPIQSIFTSTQTPLNDQLSTITFSSLEHHLHHQQQHRQHHQQQQQRQSSDKMTYPPPPPPEIDPAATSASYGAYSTSGNLTSGELKR